MIGEQLFRERLVAREDQPARIASGVAKPQQLQIADDVLIEGRDAGKRFHQVEDDVQLEEAGGRTDAGEIVVHAEHAHLVPLLAQRLDDVVLHLPLRLEDVDARRVLGWDEMFVHERKDASLHR